MRRLGLPACLAALLLTAGTARAAVVLALDLRTLTRTATVIADLEVVDQESERLPTGQIVTWHVALVREGLKGALDGDEVRFFTEGGVVDGVGARVVGEPHPRLGARVVAFLQPAGPGLRFVGMSQGCLTVADGTDGVTRVMPTADGAHLVTRTPGGFQPAVAAVASPRALAPFLEEVRSLVAR